MSIYAGGILVGLLHFECHYAHLVYTLNDQLEELHRHWNTKFLEKTRDMIINKLIPLFTFPFRPVTQYFFAAMTYSIWGPFLVLITKNTSEVCVIGSLHKRCYITPLMNKLEASTNIAESARVEQTLMPSCSNDQI